MRGVKLKKNELCAINFKLYALRMNSYYNIYFINLSFIYERFVFIYKQNNTETFNSNYFLVVIV